LSRVAVITPTWGPLRHRSLLDRCIPSVAAQSYSDWEHLVISDGPDPGLRLEIGDGFVPGVRYLELDKHLEPHSYGNNVRNIAADHTDAEYLAYLDSDNAYRPDHLEVLVRAIEATEADFAYSRMQIVGGPEIGADPPCLGQVDTSLIFHRRRDLERFGGWPVEPGYGTDWKFIEGWIQKGASWAFVPKITVDYHRSLL
jgi:glycosyltransferase involved in cell wall biosynthesis